MERLSKNIDFLYGGGYYEIDAIQVFHYEDSNSPKGALFVDICILTAAVYKNQDKRIFVNANENCSEEQTQLVEIMESLNGIGRFIFYRVFNGQVSDPRNKAILGV